MLNWFLCRRYLLKRPMALAGIFAVGLCVAFLIVVTSLFSGFIDAFEYHLEQSAGEVVLQSMVAIHQFDELERMLEAQPKITRAVAHIETGALLYLGRGDVRAVQVVGASAVKLAQGTAFGEGLLINEAQQRGFALSQSQRETAQRALEEKLGRVPSETEMPVPLIVGIAVLAEPDEATDAYPVEAIRQRVAQQDEPMVLTLSSGSHEDVTVVHRSGWCVDVVQTGWHFADSSQVFVPLEALLEMMGHDDGNGNRLGGVSVKIYGADGADYETIASAAKQGWSDFAREVLGLDEVGASVYAPLEQPGLKRFTAEIRKQMVVVQLILGFIGLVSSLLIFVILYMLVTQKQRDIGIIRSVGSGRGDVAGLFLGFGLVVGAAGSLLGLFLGGLCTRNIAWIEGMLAQVFGLKIWKSGVYMFARIPDEVAWGSVWWIALLGVGFAAIGAVMPAVRAARLQPAESLRFE